MHEFSICQQIIKQVEQAVEEGDEVTQIQLLIGELTAVDTQALTFWFEIAAKNTCAAKARLTIELVPATAKCLQCYAEFALSQRLSRCGTCNSYRYQLLSGDELKLKQLEVA